MFRRLFYGENYGIFLVYNVRLSYTIQIESLAVSIDLVVLSLHAVVSIVLLHKPHDGTHLSGYCKLSG